MLETTLLTAPCYEINSVISIRFNRFTVVLFVKLGMLEATSICTIKFRMSNAVARRFQPYGAIQW
jgi:hypothetical protein